MFETANTLNKKRLFEVFQNDKSIRLIVETYTFETAREHFGLLIG